MLPRCTILTRDKSRRQWLELATMTRAEESPAMPEAPAIPGRFTTIHAVLRFRVRYHGLADLTADHDQQLARGGLMVRVEAPEGLKLFDAVELEIETEAGTFEIAAQVVQIFPGKGIALSFSIEGNEGFLGAVEAGRAQRGAQAPAPEHMVVDAARGAAESEPVRSDKAAKIHLALHGNKDERARIIRGGDRSVHRYVLRNPGLGLDEVTFIAKLTTVSSDILKAIAERRDWAGRPEIALALVSNPKTPVPLAIQLLKNVAPQQLQRLAKTGNLRMPILQAARKLVINR
jgi:hypothetical protein